MQNESHPTGEHTQGFSPEFIQYINKYGTDYSKYSSSMFQGQLQASYEAYLSFKTQYVRPGAESRISKILSIMRGPSGFRGHAVLEGEKRVQTMLDLREDDYRLPFLLKDLEFRTKQQLGYIRELYEHLIINGTITGDFLEDDMAFECGEEESSGKFLGEGFWKRLRAESKNRSSKENKVEGSECKENKVEGSECKENKVEGTSKAEPIAAMNTTEEAKDTIDKENNKEEAGRSVESGNPSDLQLIWKGYTISEEDSPEEISPLGEDGGIIAGVSGVPGLSVSQESVPDASVSQEGVSVSQESVPGVSVSQEADASVSQESAVPTQEVSVSQEAVPEIPQRLDVDESHLIKPADERFLTKYELFKNQVKSNGIKRTRTNILSTTTRSGSLKITGQAESAVVEAEAPPLVPEALPDVNTEDIPLKAIDSGFWFGSSSGPNLKLTNLKESQPETPGGEEVIEITATQPPKEEDSKPEGLQSGADENSIAFYLTRSRY